MPGQIVTSHAESVGHKHPATITPGRTWAELKNQNASQMFFLKMVSMLLPCSSFSFFEAI